MQAVRISPWSAAMAEMAGHQRLASPSLSAVGRVALRRYLQTMGAVLQALDG